MTIDRRPRRSLRGLWSALGDGVSAPVIAAILLVYSRVSATQFNDPHPIANWILDVSICTAAALSRRFRISSTIVVAASLAAWLLIPEPTPMIGTLAFCIPIFTSVADGHVRLAIVQTVLFGTLTSVLFEQGSKTTAEVILNLTSTWMLILFTWLVGIAINRHVKSLANMRLVHQAETQLQRHAVARDLHDTVASAMTRIVMRAEAAKLRGVHDAEALADLDYILETGRQGSHDLRAMLGALRDSDEPVGDASLWNIESLAAVVDERVDELRAAGFTVESSVRLDEPALPPSIRNTMGKVVVEATSNMLKHARSGGECTILVEQDDAQIEALFVNRVGSGPTRSERQLGLVGISERLTTLGGELEHQRTGNTWVLSARLPLKGLA